MVLSNMKPILPLFLAVAFAATTHQVLAQRVETLYGVAKIDLPSGMLIKAFKDKDMGESYVIAFSEAAVNEPFMTASPKAFFNVKKLSKSESRWSDKEWLQKLRNYYDAYNQRSDFDKYETAGRGNWFSVDYQNTETFNGSTYRFRDYTKYLRANRDTQVQGYYATSDLRSWGDPEAIKLRAAISSLRAARR